MKRYALLLLLAATAGCHKDDPAPADPLLGLWQAEEMHFYRYDGRGNVTADSMAVINFAMRIERDSIKQYDNGNYVQVYAYRRTGDAINIPLINYTWYVRSFTPTSFVEENNYSYRNFTRYTIHYHR